ncbi:MAG: hypothetical protein JXA68_07575 [Ignavibacteriales bacterium]|nr:hypothetical protein [Ignavibacteriales bacterium]
MYKKVFVPILFLFFFFLADIISAQTIYFCEGVDDNGYPITESSTFYIDASSGGYLYFLARIPYAIGCYEISYDIYKVDKYGNETYETTIYQDVQPSWTWFWKKVTFYEKGTYYIYLYDEDSYLLASGTLYIKYN